MIAHDCDLFVRLLDGSFREYQRSAQRWWQRDRAARCRRAGRSTSCRRTATRSRTCSAATRARTAARSSSSCAAATSRISRRATTRRSPRGDDALATNILYYSLRAFLHEPGADDRMDAVQECRSRRRHPRDACRPARSTSTRRSSSSRKLQPRRARSARARARHRAAREERRADRQHRLPARHGGVSPPVGGRARRRRAARHLHHGQGGDAQRPRRRRHDLRRSSTTSTRRTRTCSTTRSTAADVQPFMRHGTVLDNQKALTVRSRVPAEPRVHGRVLSRGLHGDGDGGRAVPVGGVRDRRAAAPSRRTRSCRSSIRRTFELGVIHYASDTPYSRRQSLLSKSLSYFGMESTYGCAIAIARRIFDERARAAVTTMTRARPTSS